MYKYCRMDDLEWLEPENSDRFYGIVEKILAQNELILRSVLANPMAECRQEIERNKMNNSTIEQEQVKVEGKAP